MAFRFIQNNDGILELLRSPGVLADLERRAAQVAAAASDDVATYDVHTEIGLHRARAAVVTSDFDAILAEHREHRLARAIDAAR